MADQVSVVISTVKGGPRLVRCVEALVSQDPPPKEIIVALAVGLVEIPLGTRGVLPVRTPSHHAPTANAGIREANAEHVVVLNDDTCARPGFLAALLAAVQTWGPGLYQPRILLPDGRVDNMGHDLFPDGFNRARGRGCANSAVFDKPRTVGAISGAAFLASRALLDDIGLFDDAFEAFGEDADLSLRARRRGYPLRYVPDAVIEHELGASYGRNGPAKIYRVERNRVRLALRSLPLSSLATMQAWTTVRWAAFLLGTLSARGLAAEVPILAGGAAALAGTVAGWAHAPEALARRQADASAWRLGEWDMIRFLWDERVRSRL